MRAFPFLSGATIVMSRENQAGWVVGLFVLVLSAKASAQETLLLVDVGCQDVEPGWVQLDTCGLFEDLDGSGIDVTLETGNPEACSCRSPGATQEKLPGVQGDLLFADDAIGSSDGDFIIRFGGLSPGTTYLLSTYHHRSDEGDTVIQAVEVTGAPDNDAPAEIVQSAELFREPAEITFTASSSEVKFRYVAPDWAGPAPQQTILNGFILTRVDGSSGGPVFQRGNADGTGSTELTDGVFVLNFLFLGGTSPPCDDAADVDDNGVLELTDGVFLLNFLFLGGSSPPAPTGGCDADPTPDDLACAAFPACL